MFDNNTAIEVDNVSKIYRIGAKEEMHDSFAKAAFNFIINPLKNYRKYRSLYVFDDAKESIEAPSNIIWAVKDVSFDVAKGDVLGIIGKNGAGKSTLLKILCRITNPVKGRVRTRGRISSLLEVGTGFHDELTGRENVYLNGTILGMSRLEVKQKFDEIVNFSGVEKFIDTPVKRYSSGMKVRLAFSVAAHLEPEILIVDEVLAVGDADFQKKCLNKMENVGQQGRTVVFVSHNMAAVTRLCQRAILMDQGKVIDNGPASQIVAAYLTSGTGTSAKREWKDSDKAPSGKYTRLNAVKIRTDERIAESIDIRQPFTIEITFDVFEPGAILLPNFGLYNEEGICVFAAVDTDMEWRKKIRPKGRFTSIAHVPGNLLAEGVHFLNCFMITLNPDSIEFGVPSVASFTIIDSFDGDSARGDYAKNLIGVVRPLLTWKTEFNPVV